MSGRMIPVRAVGVVLLLAVGVVPLAVFGWLALRRSERTAIQEVRRGNQRVAEQVAGRIEAYLRRERQMLAAIGVAAVQARSPGDAAVLLEGYSLEYRHLHDLIIYRDGAAWAADALARPSAASHELAAQASAGKAVSSTVRPPDRAGAGGFAHTMTIAVPLRVAGQLRGALVANVDLVGLWDPVNRVRVGERGFVRLLSGDGELLAHGDPEERRYVFNADPAVDQALVAAARGGELADNQAGERVVAVVADVPGTDWKVLVEQPVSEAFAPARAMRRDLLVIGAAALLVALIAGVAVGRRVVRPLEQLQAHTRVLAGGDLAARAVVPTRIAEVAALASSLDEMAGALHRLQEEARTRERVTTFGQVAAGLAHDLRLPIENLQAACSRVLKAREDPGAWALFEKMVLLHLPRLQEYMADLVQLSREGEIDRRMEKVDLAAVAREVAEAAAADQRFQGVGFQVTGSASPLWVNRSLFRRALHNLAANAARACFRSGRKDAGVTFELADAGDRVQLRVVDAGTGMTPEQRERILAGDFASGERQSGIGLGLGVVRHVIQGHGGTLTIESEVGKGSTFTIVLPHIEPAGPAERISMANEGEGA